MSKQDPGRAAALLEELARIVAALVVAELRPEIERIALSAARTPGAGARSTYLDDRELARRTGLARVTFRIWRAKGEGPPYSKVGRRCIYDWAEVQAWIEARKA